MKVTLKKLRLSYFKGLKDIEVLFNESETWIYGANKAGKTTILDAYLFLLFGKDSTDRKVFSIKTLDENNVPMSRIDHTVEGIFDIDGREVSFKRVYKEIWRKPHGEEKSIMDGHTTDFYCDKVPVKAKEYGETVSNIIKEDIFKLLSNPLYFNTKIEWTDKRAMLVSIVGDITDEDIAKGNPKFTELLEKLGDKSFERYKSQLAETKKDLKKELEKIPVRIDETHVGMPEEPDYNALQSELIIKEAEATRISGVIANESKGSEEFNRLNQEHARKIGELIVKMEELKGVEAANLRKLENDINNHKSSLQEAYDDAVRNISAYDYSALEQSIKDGNAEMDILRKKWNEVNREELVISEDESICPTCKQSLPETDVKKKQAELLANFNANKTKRLQDITNNGGLISLRVKESTDRVESYKKLQKQAEQKAQECKIELDRYIHNTETVEEVTIEDALAENKAYQDILKEIDHLDKNRPVEKKVDVSELEESLRLVNEDIKSINASLAIKDTIEKDKERIKYLEGQMKELGQQLADCEKDEFVMEQFTIKKINALEHKINALFSTVKFKMFEKLNNGGTKECCECLVNGVPFPDANSAGKMQAGIEVIKVLSEKFDAYLPLVCDNREGVTEIPEINTQVINLVVSPEDKELRVV